ncbi:MAG: hypothetical protein JNN22_13390 [Rhodospirillales bacterium]|nr:hypothetical protein [Rhodospirillales bacterium]
MQSDPPNLKLDRYTELPISSIGECPVLSKCFAAWKVGRAGGRIPAAMDMSLIPDEALPYTMLLDYRPELRDVHVRIAGNYVGERANFGSSTRGLRGFFNDADAEIVFESLVRIAATGEPSLARRDYVTIEGRRYGYTRLILPLSADGRTVTGFFKTIEPASLTIA